jgi:hypothetical protein
MLSLDASLDPEEIRDTLIQTATPTGAGPVGEINLAAALEQTLVQRTHLNLYWALKWSVPKQ